jgi:predicted ABC-class ATPase
MQPMASMHPIDDLYDALAGLDGKGYKAYKTVEGAYEAPRLTFYIDHAQGDPFAEPTRVRALVGSRHARFPEWAFSSDTRRRAAADFLNRRLLEATTRRSRDRGSGKSGEIQVLGPT